ncbi:MAG: epoxide hydrolase 1 [Rhodospirillales bacterium]|nr:epoxide hydrolase 1 [Rhodospirillales bacterium]
MMTSLDVRPFRIAVPDKDVADLKDRLGHTRLPDLIPGAGWDYGVDLNWAKETVDYWRDEFDWRKQEAILNAFPQFMTSIEGQPIHFIHVQSPEPNALPMIMTHGWPSTFADFAGMISALTDPRRHGGDPADAFDVVIPSIPGFAFSSPMPTGWDSARIAGAWHTLMQGLGYDRYVAHGGDAGSFITRQMGIAAPAGLLAIHVLEIFDFPTGEPGELDDMSQVENDRMMFMFGFNDVAGYHRLHQTRPLTLDYALNDSPAGQLAWICDPMMGFGRFAPPEPRNLDDVLTNVSLYWFTKTAGSSARWYQDDARTGAGQPKPYNSTPTGVAMLPYNLQTVRKIAERLNNIVYWSTLDRGGHFAALDAPHLLTGDLRRFFRDFRG